MITNQLVFELLSLLSDDLFCKRDICKIFANVFSIEDAYVDKQFCNKLFHQNYIKQFMSDYQKFKVNPHVINKKVQELLPGGKLCPKKSLTKEAEKEFDEVLKSDKCCHCNLPKELYFCRICRKAKYCSVECLCADLKKHKAFCDQSWENFKKISISPPGKQSQLEDVDLTQILNKKLYENKILENQLKNLKQQHKNDVLNLNQRINIMSETFNKHIQSKNSSPICMNKDVAVDSNLEGKESSNSRSRWIDLSSSTKTYSKKCYLYTGKFIDGKVKRNCSLLLLQGKRKLKKNRNISKHLLNIRAKKLMDAITCISGYKSNLDSYKRELCDIKLLLKTFFKRYPDLSLELSKDKEILKQHFQLSPKDASMFTHNSFRTWYTRRKVSTMLKKKTGFNPLGSEKKQRKFEKDSLKFINDKANFEYGTMLLKKTARAMETTEEPYVKVKSLKSYIIDIIERELEHGDIILNDDFYCRMDGKFWIVISLDHGGDLAVSSNMKYSVQILANKVYPYAMYEASDIVENQWAVHGEYYSELHDMVTEGVLINGKKYDIELFCKGDMKAAFEVLGLSGQSGSFPSRYSLVTLEHLRENHSNGTPHGPEYCGNPEIRTVTGIIDQFYCNKMDTRNNGDLRKNARYHQSVFNRPLLPLKTIYHSCPNILHYKLGTTMEGHKKMKLKIREKVSDDQNAFLLKLEDERVKISIELGQANLQKRNLCTEVIEKRNLIRRLEAYPNSKLLNKACLAENQNRGLKKQSDFKKWIFPYSCKYCIISIYDYPISWLECDTCKKKFHSLCIAETYEEISNKLIIDSILCAQCSNRKHPEELLEDHQRELQNKEFQLMSWERKVKNLEKLEEQKLSEHAMYTCQEEQLFDQLLKKFNIHEQSQHGGTLIGNHCDILLDNYEIYCQTLPKQEDKDFFMDYFKVLKFIIRKCSAKRWLSESEIKEVEHYCHRFGELWPKLTKTITLKADDIIYHIPKFLKQWKTIGMFSEEDTESLHRECNNILRPLYSMKNKGEKLYLGLKRLTYKRNYDSIDPDYSKPSKRKSSRKLSDEFQH